MSKLRFMMINQERFRVDRKGEWVGDIKRYESPVFIFQAEVPLISDELDQISAKLKELNGVDKK